MGWTTERNHNLITNNNVYIGFLTLLEVPLNLFDQENEQTFNAKIKSNIALDRNQIEKFRSITKVALLQQKALSWSLMPVLMMEKFTGANMANKTLAASGIQRIKLNT